MLPAGDSRAHVCPALSKVRTSTVAVVLTFARLIFLCAPRATASLTRVVPCAQLLMPHQATGVKWLLDAVDRGGGLLTDEPGLGKTLQAVTLIEALIASRRVARVLIVVPANLCASPQPCLVRCSSCSCASCRPCALSCQLLGARAHALRSRPPDPPRAGSPTGRTSSTGLLPNEERSHPGHCASSNTLWSAGRRIIVLNSWCEYIKRCEYRCIFI